MSDMEQSNNNGAAIAKPEPQRKTLATLLEGRMRELEQLGGKLITPERLIRLAILAVGSSEYLQKCSVSSIVGSVLHSARMGLEIDGIHAAIVPMSLYNKQTKQKEWTAQCWPMARGLVARAYDDPSIEEITPRVVYDGEHFAVRYGSNPIIEHEPDADAIQGGEVIAAYAVIHMRGRAKFDVMYRSEIDAIMKRSPSVRAGAHSPWETDFPEMAKKTVLKRIIKTAPIKSRRLQEAVGIDDENDGVDVIDMPAPEEQPRASTEPKRTKRTDGLKEKIAKEKGHDQSDTRSGTAGAREHDEVDGPPPDDAPPIGEAKKPEAPKEAARSTTTQAPPSPGTSGTATATGEPEMITDEQKTKLLNLCDKGGATTAEKRLAVVGGALGVTLQAIGALTRAQASEAIRLLSGPPKEDAGGK